MDCGKSFQTQGESDQLTGRCPSWTAESAKVDDRNRKRRSRLADYLNAARTNQQYIKIGDLDRADSVDDRSIIEFYTRAELAHARVSRAASKYTSKQRVLSNAARKHGNEFNALDFSFCIHC